ncbi:uncharacterized protein Z519_01089 [Cladophialophora bantiana CBS 173.52]|uniref:Clr5 domain-containing protein n=1 Tax=Cladophialophora bantiana (strain ATCC 10958 / CBS 173.52 / CDC B-1940 / NIH 8579) TaxID=1442370 RepID=A0A0D2I2Y3_CLAB1|nr:uncharacterized protein Z519_01089 [Cladophialophora bantiana CBS 173.52]KIW97505.1 hypothetical protein Z519_01089 [Cladophialophora bantiana CBS 173.52]
MSKGKKLSDVVDIMKSRGFRAECTYIKKRGLDKKNKANQCLRSFVRLTGLTPRAQEIDMVFAFQKLQGRHGKDTVFKIRGRDRSHRAVGNYWKRRGVNPAQFADIPRTPPCVAYRTPSPCPGKDGLADVAREHATLDNDWTVAPVSSPSSPSSPISSLRARDFSTEGRWVELTSTCQSFGLRSLRSPELSGSHEQILFYTKRCFERSVEYFNCQKEAQSLGINEKALALFLRKWLQFESAYYHNLFDAHEKVSYMDVLNVIPDLLQHINLCRPVGYGLDAWLSTYDQYRTASYHVRIGNLEASTMTEVGLQMCTELKYDSKVRTELRSKFLYLQGIIRQGNLQMLEALDSLNEALGLRLALFGAGDHLATAMASLMRNIELQHRVEVLET